MVNSVLDSAHLASPVVNILHTMISRVLGKVPASDKYSDLFPFQEAMRAMVQFQPQLHTIAALCIQTLEGLRDIVRLSILADFADSHENISEQAATGVSKFDGGPAAEL
jgi:hypothetical protein